MSLVIEGVGDSINKSEEVSTSTVEKYSFSKLSSWWTCPFGYFQRYIEHKPGIGNAFSSYGTLVHELMEKYAKNEIELWDLPEVYEWQFGVAIPEKFPYNKYVDLKKTYYQQGLTFLKNFQGYDKYEILGVEEEFSIGIDDWEFRGVIDLVFRDENGRLIIRDYKSKAKFKSDEEQAQYARQLYLYSLYVKEKYGEYPEELQFLMFRKQKDPVQIKFTFDALQEAVEWAKNTVFVIRNAFDYPAKCDGFYSENLCNHRQYCPKKIKKSNIHKK